MSVAIGLSLAAMLLSPGVGRAPDLDTGANVVGSTVGIDGATIAWSMGYARAIQLPIPRVLVVGTQFTMPMTQPDFGDWRWRTGARIDSLVWGRFAWPFEADFVLRRLANRSVKAWGLGSELITMPGYYPRRWFLAAEVSWDQQWGTHLEHSDAYRNVVYDEVQDGWYRTTGFTMRYGARVGGRPWKRMELWLRAGFEQHGRFDTVAPPVYAIAGLNFRF